jgi:hypothetical protein
MDMIDRLDPKDARDRALLFAKFAARCASPKAQQRFVSITKNWIALAFELEQHRSSDALRGFAL